MVTDEPVTGLTKGLKNQGITAITDFNNYIETSILGTATP